MELKRDILKICMQKGFLLDKTILEIFLKFEYKFISDVIDSLSKLNIVDKFIKKETFFDNYEKIGKLLSDKKDFETFLSFLDFKKPDKTEEIKVDLKNNSNLSSVKLLSTNIVNPKKVEVKDFVNHFKNRYETIKNILQQRNLENLKSIRRLTNDNQNSFIIGMILDKRSTKNKNLIFEVEDLTGKIKVLVNFNKPELYDKAKDLLLDEVVAFNVSGNNQILFANDIIFPDTILDEKRKCSEEIYVAFSSDVHVGSKMFLEESFLKFIKWLNGEEGDESQREIAKKIKYLFLTGDNVDGIGVFPGQEQLLEIPETIAQYKKLASYLKLIRKDIRIIICPGQHDAVWVGEPQPAIGEFWASDLYNMENVFLVTNPSLVEIEGGFKVLMYHGASMHGIIEEIQDIRLNYGHNSPTRVVKEMLKRRHLAPMHGSCDYVPNEFKDPMVLDIVPDIIATGDQHRQEISLYNNILLIASSCWQSKTPFEEKVGNNPDPCKVPVLNLKTREIKIFDFSLKEKTTNVEQVCNEKEGQLVCEVKK